MDDTTTTIVLDRMIAASGLKSDADLARYLGKTSQAASKARKTGKIPVAWVPKIAAQFNLSTDYLFWGKEWPTQPEVEAFANCDVMVPIPIVEARLSAGVGSLQVGGNIFSCENASKTASHSQTFLMATFAGWASVRPAPVKEKSSIGQVGSASMAILTFNAAP